MASVVDDVAAPSLQITVVVLHPWSRPTHGGDLLPRLIRPAWASRTRAWEKPVRAGTDAPPTALDVVAPTTTVGMDRTLRLKILDACGMTCTFCHNEGTPVAADNRTRRSEGFTTRGASGRTSLYVSTNGARFLPATMRPDDHFLRAVALVRDALDIDEAHLTGGEPTLHPRLGDIVTMLRAAGMRVRMTSNGESGGEAIRSAVSAGLESVSFSVFGTTAAELASVQSPREDARAWAELKMRKLASAVHMALACGASASANIVVPDVTHAPRVHHLLERFGTDLSVRLLNSLADGRKSLDAIECILDDLAAVPVSHHLIAGSSGWRTAFRLPNGRSVHVKRIRPARLPGVCDRCHLNNPRDCQEGYYGVRLYRDTSGVYHVGLCLQRMDLCLPVEQFVTSDLPDQIIRLRRSEFERLTPRSSELA